MTRQRLSREETQAQTRAAILESAEQHFLEHGFAGASLDEIAESAGYSKGAIYSNFDSKHDLFHAVSKAREIRAKVPLQNALDQAESFDLKVRALKRWAGGFSPSDFQWLLVSTEHALIAHRDPAMAESLRDWRRQAVAEQTRVVEEQARLGGVKLKNDARVIAEVLTILEIGLAVNHAVDSEHVSELFPAIFSALLDIVIAQD